MVAGALPQCFNPLHCGAVVASEERFSRALPALKFQSPSLRGSGRFSLAWGTRVSTSSCFNPLHCGAVVASAESRTDVVERIEFQSPSLRGSGRFSVKPSGQPSTSLGFNPLHCGAVVASVPGNQAMACSTRVSIPFIAGQWSLPLEALGPAGPVPRVSIPFIAGQWSLRDTRPASEEVGQVSIPFIAGQWSLPQARRRRSAEGYWFQSPSLRGSGRFWRAWAEAGARAVGFNPLHCGAVVAS